MEVQIAEIRKDVAYLKEKADAIAENQKETFKAIEEFHTFKGQVKIMGTALVITATAFFNWLFKQIGRG